MDVESLAKQLILQNMTPEQQTAVLDGIKASLAQAKEVQKRKIGENVGVVVQALKKIESDIRERYDELGNVIEKRVASIKDGKDGKNGQNGRDGKDGRAGRDGAAGAQGQRGQDGTNGVDGTDGVSVVDAHIDFDGSLIIGLSSGRVINVGEVVTSDLAEKIKVITNGGGTSQSVLDTLASLQTQINTLIPSQTGNSGKFLTTNGTALSWSSVAGGLSYQGTWNASTNTPTLASGVGINGYYYITSTAGSTNLDGITDWQIGDWLMFNGTVWQKIDQSNLVTSVAGKTGAVTLTTADVSGLNTMSVQAANNVSITGGSITGITDLAVADGGTGASTAPDARTNLGLVIGTDVLAPNGSAASLTSFPTLNQNTTGTASNVTGVVAVANGGTGVATTTANFIFAGPSSGSPAAPTFRALTTADIPALAYGTGTVTSVALSLPSIIAVTGSPVTTSGTLTGTLTTQAANAIFAGPSSGAGAAPTFRALTTADIPALSYVTSVAASVPAFLSISGSPITTSGTLAISYSGTALPIANGGTGQTTAAAAFNALSPVTTTGDLILGNGTNSATRLAIGANNYVLTSNGTTATWAAATGGVTQIIAGTNVTISPAGGTGAVTINASGGGSSAYNRTSFTATAGQTVFSVTYAVGYLQVYVNGVLLATSDYTASSGTDFTLGVACVVGDIVEALVITTSISSSGITTGKAIAMAMIFGY